MTIQERIVEYLSLHPEGVDDDVLTAALGLKHRQQANQRCRRLERFGVIARRRIGEKIMNFLNPNARTDGNVIDHPSLSADQKDRPWFWEGHVQKVVVDYLQNSGYRIVSAANTATKEPGKDVVAVDALGQTLWISAKGYPVGTVRTSPRTQARHWFAHALFDLVLWHGEDASVQLSLALPENQTYRKLSKRVNWFLSNLRGLIFWVGEDGSIEIERFCSDK